MEQVIVFDGHRLNDLFYVGEVAVGMPEFVPNVEDRVGNGAMVRGMRLAGPQITARLVVRPSAGVDGREALSTLASWLDVDGPRELSLSGDGGLARMAVPRGTPSVEGGSWNDVVTIELYQPDPALLGASRSAVVPSAGQVSVIVGGDYPTRPTVTCSAATRNATSRLWGVRLDGGDYLRVSVPTSSAVAIGMDCDARACVVNGDVCVPTIESDWLVLRPGTHVIRNDVGTGASTVTWRERWHR